ncbi:protein GVQW3 [Trichonephila clavipes]|nr:protein GVQW3 [Trichonephila clavipes]
MMKTAFGDEAMSRTRVFEWFRRFKEDRQSVNSDSRSGRPSTSRNEDQIAQVKAVLRSDRRLTVREIAQECHISVGSCDEILRKDLNMRQVSAKFAPRLLTEDQQFQRLTTSSDLFQSASDNPDFRKLIITGNESWAYGNDHETKQQSSQWNPQFSLAKEGTAGERENFEPHSLDVTRQLEREAILHLISECVLLPDESGCPGLIESYLIG